MAKADRHSMGPGAQGKGDGSGAMTDLPEGILGENAVLSNRDKSQHSDERGLDSRHVQTEQYHDHVGARQVDDQDGESDDAAEANSSGLAGPMTNTSGDAGSLRDKPGG
ncbi:MULTISPECIES: hypothetical protein [Methylorubrum]|uniref:hypothetical protein n=1 Tax=Methylorubrum TaxID=2282523 RepID=UPI00209F6B9D|nr:MULTISPECIES: hypothetical protein [Methylorubrum]MCP1549764.1 hypothetical protein [Methylorubrum zatmanii]MCP1553622.1 hypothetical protein [Methylorubrum extorquens]MCP1580066.1 hypothetical protein [Methylorubrum extorquens]